MAQRFLTAVGFTHGLFNMEFLHDSATDRLTVIEFNPRMASQYSDLYLRVLGIDMHVIGLALAHGRDPKALPRGAPTAARRPASSTAYSTRPRGRIGPKPRRPAPLPAPTRTGCSSPTPNRQP
ncbi:MAG: hypothetical protein ABI589_11595 [Burkholderiales bacterium]